MGKHKCKSCRHKKCKCKVRCTTCYYGACLCSTRCGQCFFGACVCKVKCTVCRWGRCICVKTTITTGGCGPGCRCSRCWSPVFGGGGVFSAVDRGCFGAVNCAPWGVNCLGNPAPLIPGLGFNPWAGYNNCLPCAPVCAPVCGPVFGGGAFRGCL